MFARSEAAESRPSPRLEIALATFAILALELAVIRWMSQQIRIFAYLNNLLLIASFLGMGLGVAIGKKRPALFHWTLPSLLVLSSILSFSGELGLMHTVFPDLAVFHWQLFTLDVPSFVAAVIRIMMLFALVTWVFACAGTKVGEAFGRLEALDAYSADLIGSLGGIVAIAIATAFNSPPPVWFAIGAAPIVILTRRPMAWLSFVGLLILTSLSIKGASFSPYNRIDLSREDSIAGRPIKLSVNRDFHQLIHGLSPEWISLMNPSESERRELARYDIVYSLPFVISPRKERALIVGAGTGNDTAAALRRGVSEIISVDIDPVNLAIGKRLHPERPYEKLGSTTVTNDARAYFRSNSDQRFDIVCFGLLDSHAMFSAMSSLRLDNYVYTVEGVRSAWNLVNDGGLLSISFSTIAGAWISDRIYTVIYLATGQKPIVIDHGMHQAKTFIVGKGFDARGAAERLGVPISGRVVDVVGVRPTTDDWPFLYLRPGTFPTGYLTVLACVLILAFVSARAAFGRGLFSQGGFDPVLFLLGAAFLLIETRGVTHLSLLFGSTWVVNLAVFSGILVTVLGANLVVQKTNLRRPGLFAIPLFVALLANYFVQPDALAGMPVLERALIAGILNGLPVGFAGLFFSSLLRESADSSAALGSNLLGAVVGGCLEYSSMWIGLRNLTLVALAIYSVAFVLAINRARVRRA